MTIVQTVNRLTYIALNSFAHTRIVRRYEIIHNPKSETGPSLSVFTSLTLTGMSFHSVMPYS